jgi:uncharacterized membrane protein YidH (DUF202 family)
VLWRTVAIGLLASVGTAILPLPASIVGAVTKSTTWQGVAYAAELAIITAIAVPVLITQWRRLRDHRQADYTNPLILGYAAIYLVVMAFLWVTALPAYLSAVRGITPTGDPIGNLWYAIACFVVAGLSIAAASVASRHKPRQSEEFVGANIVRD